MNNSWYNIKVTRTLLEKNENDLSEKEKKAISNYNENKERLYKKTIDANREIREKCPILCSGYDKEFIPSSGWIEPIRNFCFQLEALNIQYAKYGIKVTSSQNKSKYGTYRCYYDIEDVPVGFLKYPINFCNGIIDRLTKIDYGRKMIEDECPKVTIEWREIEKKEFDDRKMDIEYLNRKNSLLWNDSSFKIHGYEKTWKNFMNEENKEFVEEIHYTENELMKKVNLDDTNVFKEENGKYFIAYELNHGPKTHMIFTRNHISRHILNSFRSIRNFLEKHVSYPKNRDIMVSDFEIKVEELYKKCEDKCTDLCEHCGTPIGTDYSPACCTEGWIAYLCDRCVTADGGNYIKNGELWNEDKMLQDKETYEKSIMENFE